MGPPEHPNLRAWRDDDLAPYVALHADPDVGYWLGGAWSEARSREAFESSRRAREDGLGLWPIVDDADELVGVAGLYRTRADLPPAPAVEAAWRLLPRARGRGLATSAIRAILDHGFEVAGLDRIIAYTARPNVRSQAVMTRLGFQPRPEADFDHPALAREHPLRPHVVYVLQKGQEPRC